MMFAFDRETSTSHRKSAIHHANFALKTSKPICKTGISAFLTVPLAQSRRVELYSSESIDDGVSVPYTKCFFLAANFF